MTTRMGPGIPASLIPRRLKALQEGYPRLIFKQSAINRKYSAGGLAEIYYSIESLPFSDSPNRQDERKGSLESYVMP